MEEFTTDLLKAGAVIVVALVLRIVVAFAIRRVTAFLLAKPLEGEPRFGTRASAILGAASRNLRHEQRVRTLGSLLRSVVDVALIILTLLTVLAIFGIPMAPLLASAGIGGVAIGFGAQSLVKDYLSGIFMLVEDQFGVGDLIKIDAITGHVEEVTLRVTKVRDATGILWYVRNGEVLTLGNVSQGTTSTIVEVPIAADEDADRAIRVLREALTGFHEEDEFAETVLEQPTVLGVGAVDGSRMTLQISLKTGPNQQWGPMRVIRQRSLAALAEAGIRGPILPGVPQA
jgi:moderate conductance mechanosensitive channel